MNEEDFLPRKKPAAVTRNLVDMSVSELEDYIGDLKNEIKRVEGDIIKKKASQAAAASVFKS